MGCLELMQMAARWREGLRVTILVHTAHAQQFNRILARLNPQATVRLLQVTDFSPAMAMALVDRTLRARELGEPLVAPAQDEEFVLSHADCLEASGFVQHLKLPHYVDFQSELELVRKLRAAHAESQTAPANVAGKKVA